MIKVNKTIIESINHHFLARDILKKKCNEKINCQIHLIKKQIYEKSNRSKNLLIQRACLIYQNFQN